MRLPKSYRYLVRQLDERISWADCLLVLAGMYVAHRGWIQSEIEAAQEFGKAIIAVQPRGNERFPEALMRITHLFFRAAYAFTTTRDLTDVSV